MLGGVSGKNRSQRKRRQNKARARHGIPTRGRARTALRLPGLREVYEAVIESSDELVAAEDAFDAEVWLGANVAGLRAHAPTDEVYHLAMLDLIDEVERDGRPQCLVLLKGMAAVGPQGLMEPAARAVARLAARRGSGSASSAAGEAGRHEPVLPYWVDLLGEASVGDCFLWTDVYGEYNQVFCEFMHADGGRRHGLMFTIDLAFRGVLAGIEMVDTGEHVDKAVESMRKDTQRDGGRFESITASEACHRLAAALDAFTDPTQPQLVSGPKPDDEFYAALPLAVRRVSGMPGAEESREEPPAPTWQSVAEVWTAQRRRALVDEFFAARPDGWADAEIARMLAARIVDASVDVLGFPADRLGEASIPRLFGEILPLSLVMPEVIIHHAERVVREWVEWLVDSLDLPKKARRTLRRVAHAVLEIFPRMCRNRQVNLNFPYVADLSADQARGDKIFKILERRSFAVPLPGNRGDGLIEIDEPAGDLPAGQSHVDDLDAADPDHRDLITVVGQTAQGTHRDRYAAYVAVVEQLWNDEPADVWEAAQRLKAAGLPRQRILQRLVDVWQRYVPDASGTAGGRAHGDTSALDIPASALDTPASASAPDPAAGYVAALRSLGSVPGRQR